MSAASDKALLELQAAIGELSQAVAVIDTKVNAVLEAVGRIDRKLAQVEWRQREGEAA